MKEILKSGTRGALFGFLLYILSFFPFLNIPSALILSPFISFGNQLFGSEDFFARGDPMNLAIHVSFFGFILLVSICVILFILKRVIKRESPKNLRNLIFILVATIVVFIFVICNAKFFNSSIICSILANNGPEQECFRKIGIKKLDVNLCEKTSGVDTNLCYLNIAQQTSNFLLCEHISSQDYKYDFQFDCYKNTLIGKTDQSICGSINNLESRNICLEAISLNYKDPSRCNILDSKSINTCLYRMACINNDKNICNFINSEKGKYRCLEATVDNAKDFCPARKAAMSLWTPPNNDFDVNSCLESYKNMTKSECYILSIQTPERMLELKTRQIND